MKYLHKPVSLKLPFCRILSAASPYGGRMINITEHSNSIAKNSTLLSHRILLAIGCEQILLL